MAIQKVDTEVFLANATTLPVIDVRSPAEYSHGHIPGAVNIPLFNNEERALVGTYYKKAGRKEAIDIGMEIAGPKLLNFVEQAKTLTTSPARSGVAGGKALVHCWRGGMRSESFAWLLHSFGLEPTTLTKGYKAYRNYVLESFNKPAKIIIIGGETGSGKTEVIKALSKIGEQVIDLEGIAHHRGSVFGALGQEPQPTAEQFENNIASQWLKLDFSRTVWLEDESHSIGRVFIPAGLWQQMKHASILRLGVPKELRIKRLIAEYGCYDKTLLQENILKIQKRLGGQNTHFALEALAAGNLALVAGTLLTYYDKAYHFDHEKRNFRDVHFLNTPPTGDPAVTANRAAELAKRLFSQAVPASRY